MAKSNLKILYFTKGTVPTKEELAEAAKLGTKMFRNAQLVNNDCCLEPCDRVAGTVPERYKKMFADKKEEKTGSPQNPPAQPSSPPQTQTPVATGGTAPAAGVPLSLPPWAQGQRS